MMVGIAAMALAASTITLTAMVMRLRKKISSTTYTMLMTVRIQAAASTKAGSVLPSNAFPPAASASAVMFAPVSALSLPNMSTFPVLSHASSVANPSTRTSPMTMIHIIGSANMRMSMRNTKPRTTAMMTLASSSGHVLCTSPVSFPNSPAGFDITARASPNAAFPTGRPRDSILAMSSSVSSAGRDGTHLKKTSLVGYAGYQQSPSLLPGTKQLSSFPLLDNVSPRDLCKAKVGPVLSLQSVVVHEYVPRSIEASLSNANSGGQSATHNRMDASRGSGM
mmetsp:Transcript_58691/g.120041  ORF Transcript_58691/g.120041 Transcript_58691/m.120041 type:complete len:280 (+) Transcript_58691:1420-2259(+)